MNGYDFFVLNRWRDVTDASEEIENTAEENKTELPEEVLHSNDLILLMKTFKLCIL